MEVSRIALTVPGLQESLRLAVVADLHNRSGERVLQVLWRDLPDAIAVVGDMIESLYRPPYHLEDTSRCERGLAFLREACGIAPVFYSLGNHEQRSSGGVHQAIAASGVQLLDNDSVFVARYSHRRPFFRSAAGLAARRGIPQARAGSGIFGPLCVAFRS